MRLRLLLGAGLLALTACGGGGGGGSDSRFVIVSITPVPGSVAAVTSSIDVFFNQPADLATAAIELETAAGTVIPGTVQRPGANGRQVRYQPGVTLEENTLHRVTIPGTIRAENGSPLGADVVFTFVTESPTPTVRPDHVVDLGDILNVPRFRARAVRLRDGRIVVFGGESATGAVNDTAEVYDEATRTFRLLSARMTTPRTEHTATLLAGGRVLLAGGRAAVNGPALDSTEFFDPTLGDFVPGPSLNDARRWHAASRLTIGGEALVSGGFDLNGDALVTAEVLDFGGASWSRVPGSLAVGTAQHVQVEVSAVATYISPGNFTGDAAVFDGTTLQTFREGSGRFRAAAVKMTADRVLIASGDVRTVAFFRLDTNSTSFGTDIFFERRGEHTLTRIGSTNLYLAAGGFNIAIQGEPPLDSMEIVEVLDPFAATPDALVHFVRNVFLPVPFAGHIAQTLQDGSILLAGGIGPTAGPHSRRAVIIRTP